MTDPIRLPDETTRELYTQLQEMQNAIREFANKGIAAINDNCSNSKAKYDEKITNINDQLRQIIIKIEKLEQKIDDKLPHIETTKKVNYSAAEKHTSSVDKITLTHQDTNTENLERRHKIKPTTGEKSVSEKIEGISGWNQLILGMGFGLFIVGIVALVYFFILKYSINSSKLCQQVHENPHSYVELLQKLVTKDGLEPEQPIDDINRSAKVLIAKLQNNPLKLDATECETLINLLFTYSVASWCANNTGHSCDSEQKNLIKNDAQITFNNRKISEELKTLIGCGANANDAECREKVILNKIEYIQQNPITSQPINAENNSNQANPQAENASEKPPINKVNNPGKPPHEKSKPEHNH